MSKQCHDSQLPEVEEKLLLYIRSSNLMSNDFYLTELKNLIQITDLNYKDAKHKTPLMHAVDVLLSSNYDHQQFTVMLNIIEAMLENGADTDFEDNKGHSVLTQILLKSKRLLSRDSNAEIYNYFNIEEVGVMMRLSSSLMTLLPYTSAENKQNSFLYAIYHDCYDGISMMISQVDMPVSLLSAALRIATKLNFEDIIYKLLESPELSIFDRGRSETNPNALEIALDKRNFRVLKIMSDHATWFELDELVEVIVKRNDVDALQHILGESSHQKTGQIITSAAKYIISKSEIEKIICNAGHKRNLSANDVVIDIDRMVIQPDQAVLHHRTAKPYVEVVHHTQHGFTTFGEKIIKEKERNIFGDICACAIL